MNIENSEIASIKLIFFFKIISKFFLKILKFEIYPIILIDINNVNTSEDNNKLKNDSINNNICYYFSANFYVYLDW